ncbi:transposase [Microvirga vignae]|uniref:transposase n=1 Tax=Microvirga vignae TaxID=1225564 RepID=UPI000A517851|nr:transposase [Microvirga vignae]
MTSPPGDPNKPLSQMALRELVSDLAGKIDRLEHELEQLRLDNSNLRIDNQALKDEIARLKNLPPRPPFKSSGMEKATQPQPNSPGRRPGRGAKRDRVTREVMIWAEEPAGSRFKGYKTVVRRDLVLTAEVVRYKRERWMTSEGQTIIAPLPVEVAGGYGPGVGRFCFALHTQGQVTTERLTDLLNGIGLAISKREVVRLLTTDLEMFVQEDHAVLEAGLVSSPYLTVDDTGARHARRPGGHHADRRRALLCFPNQPVEIAFELPDAVAGRP